MKNLLFISMFLTAISLSSCGGDSHEGHDHGSEESRKEAQQEVDNLMKKAEEASADSVDTGDSLNTAE